MDNIAHPPGSSVRGILQARMLDWVAFYFSKGSTHPRDQTWSPGLQVDSLPSEPPGKPLHCFMVFWEVSVAIPQKKRPLVKAVFPGHRQLHKAFFPLACQFLSRN